MVHTVDVSAAAASAVPPPVATVPSHLTGHLFSADIADTLYNYRVLRMNQSLFVYIGCAERETFQEMAVAMPMPGGACTATTIIGEQMGTSHELAANFARKLQKQVYVSCNVAAEREIRPALAKRFTEEVRQFPEKF